MQSTDQKIEQLTRQARELGNQMTDCTKEKSAIEVNKKLDLIEAIKPLLVHVDLTDLKLDFENSSQGIKIGKLNDRGGYPNILTLYFQSDDFKTDAAERLELNYYTTTRNDRFEYERLVTLGEFSKSVLEKGDQLLESYNKIARKYQSILDFKRRNSYSIRKQTEQINQEIKELQEQQLFENIRVGSVFEVGTNDLDVVLEISYNDVVRNIEWIKITGMTESGKSVDLEIKSDRFIEPLNFSRVRTKYLKQFLSFYREYLK